MMQSFTSMNAVGHVGADPIIRGSQEKPFATFSLAVNNKWNKGNELVEKTDWYKVNVPGYLINLVQNHVRKDDPVAVIGSTRIQTWTQGDKSFSGICIYASVIKLLGSKSENSENEVVLPEPADESSSVEMTETAEREVDADFVPFPDDESYMT